MEFSKMVGGPPPSPFPPEPEFFDGRTKDQVYRNRSMYDIQRVTADELDASCPICGGDHAPESHMTGATGMVDKRKAYDLPMSWGDQEGVTYPPNKYGASNWAEALHDNPIPQTPNFVRQVMGLEETNPDPVVTRPRTERDTFGFN